MSGANAFEIGGRKFAMGKIDAFRQFHIVRRIGPLLAEIMPAVAALAKSKVDHLSEEEKLEQFAKVLQPVMNGFSKLSDADADYVLFRLLSVVEVHQPQFNSWAKIATDTGIMMQDIELPVLLQAAGRSLMYNLGNFFAALPRKG
jgi:hypothetical protein